MVIAGDGGADKTSFTNKFITGIYKTDTRITIGVEFFIKDIIIEGIGLVRVQMWDFGGEERFRFLLPTYIKGATGIMFLFSLTNMLTLSHFDDWLPILRNYDPKIPIMLVGTKLHLKNQRRVQQHEAIDIARSRGCSGYVEVSSKDGINVNEAFETMIKLMWQHVTGKKYEHPPKKKKQIDTLKRKRKVVKKQCSHCGEHFGIPGIYRHIKTCSKRRKNI